jgi:hypothetical protein
MAVPFQTAEVVTAVEMNELARAHWRKTTAKAVVNTVTETDLLNGEITIDAGAMSTNRLVRLTAWGDSINNTGATQAAARFKLKHGAAVPLDTGALAGPWAASASRFGWRIVAELMNLGATNSQWDTMVMDITISAVVNLGAAWTAGEGMYSTSANHLYGTAGVTASVDTTAAQALALTVINPAANALLDVTLRGAVVELV